MARVVVIGGGIAGLAAAQRLAGEPGVDVVLLEAGERLGGRITTLPFAGVALDMGPDALIARAPGGVDLVREVGLGDDLAPPAEVPALVFARGRLRPLPQGLLSGLPAGPGELLRSRILSPAGFLRAGMDLVLPAGHPPQDETVGALVRRRMGDQAFERLIDPLLGGINAGSCDELSVRSAAPQLAAAAGKDRSLIRGLRAIAPPTPPPGTAPSPVFLTLRGGLQRLPDALAAGLRADLRTGAAVASLAPAAAGGVELALGSGELLEADGVVLAAPVAAAAAILRDAVPDAADRLAEVRSASVAVAALAYPREAVGALGASGFLVARDAPLGITACTWATAKWPHLDAGGEAVLKCSLGHAGDGDAAVEMSDEEILAVARRDLQRTMGLDAEPSATLVVRHRAAFPQYEVGHAERVAGAEAALAAMLPGVALAGNAYRGVGLPSCITGARAAADGLLAGLRERGALTPDHQEITG